MSLALQSNPPAIFNADDPANGLFMTHREFTDSPWPLVI